MRDRTSQQPSRNEQVVVTRRFPTYDFVFRTSHPVPDASEKLEELLSRQTRPKGLVISDPRVDGIVSGSTFELRRRESALGGSVTPYAEGYFVPTDSGSDVVVRVQLSPWWWFFDAFVIVLVMTTIRSLSFESVGIVLLAAIGLSILTIGPIWLEGASIAKLIARVMSDKPAST